MLRGIAGTFIADKMAGATLRLSLICVGEKDEEESSYETTKTTSDGDAGGDGGRRLHLRTEK